MHAIFAVSCNEQRPRRSSFPLISYLDGADLLSNTSVIDFGDPSALMHLEQGWGPSHQDPDGTTSLVVRGERTTLWFNSLQSTDRRLRVRCKVNDASTGKITLVPVLNGERMEAKQLSGNFEDHEFLLPENALRYGRNQLALVIKSRTDTEILMDRASFSSNDAKIVRNSEGIAAPVPSEIGIYFKIPEKAQLIMDYGLVPPAKGSARISVRIKSAEGAEQTLISRTLGDGFFSTKEKSESHSLDSFQDRIVRLTLEALPIDGKPVAEKIFWKNLKLEFEPSGKNAKISSPASQNKKPNIFFYLIDALRADHLEPYGYQKAVSPNIRRFSAEAVIFERAYTQASWTRPAVASIMTGLYPSTHGTVDRGDMLADSIPTLPALLRASGYQMIGVNAQPNVGNAFGFDRNFQSYKLIADSQSDKVYEEIVKVFDAGIVQPAFTYIHVIDTHRPYSPLPEFFQATQDCKHEKEISRELSMPCARAMYDSLIRQSDFYFGAFLDTLKKKNLYQDSVIILTADHGESFMEHGMFGHGKSVYEPEIRVPLMMRFPEGKFAGKRIKGAVQHIDLLPTILDLSSTRYPPALDGQSLLNFIESEPEIRPIFSELSLDNQNDKALVLGNYKLIATKAHSGMRYKFHDLSSDPNENRNIAANEPVRFGYMRTLLTHWISIQEKRKHQTKKAILDPETEEQLKGLGYLQ